MAAAVEYAASDSSFSNDAEGDGQDVDLGATVFEHYLSVCDEAAVDPDTDALFAKGLLRVQQYLAGGRDNTTCPICLGGIKPTEAIWACGKSCFALFHMTCIQEWARNQLDTAAYKASRDTSAAAAAAANQWGCPSCRFDYHAAELPQRYTCFCGKREEPEWDPWLAPHSCGELCGKPLPGSCSHSCLLLCHPGPCPPCPLLVDAACHCGKAVMKQRCGNNAYSCRAVCGKVLPCGHTCPDTCHPGPCAPCQVVVSAACACGDQQAQVMCCHSHWQCGKVCGRQLACGRHKCDQVCHAGPCGGCPEEGARHCPCGKSLYPDLKCDEPAAVCGATCGKTLECGVHTCQERCHFGPCNKVCRELVNKPCRCGRTTKQVLCSADVRCESKCNNMRACDRHPCKRRCCDGNCPPCEEVCNRKLRCGNHRCPAPCHRGPCRPCPLSQPVSCACGKTSYTLPCGAEAAAAPPRCSHKCPVPPVCRHAADAKPHRCHFGPCPPCRSPCGSVMLCGHTCSSSTCHDPAAPAVAAFERPKPPKAQAAASSAATPASAAAAANGNGSGNSTRSSSGVDTKQASAAAAAAPAPAALAAAAAAAMAAAAAAEPSPCPPCQVPVQVGCLGGHCQRDLPCSAAAAFCCGQPCGRPLPCGNHSCSKTCHGILPGSSEAAAGAAAAAVAEACEKCERPCAKPRVCSHPCPSSCHPGPCEPCRVQVTVECYCGKTDLTFPCFEEQQVQKQQQQQEGASAAAAAAAGPGSGPDNPLCCGRSCNKELPLCPHVCAVPCHAGPCPAAACCAEEVTVRCSCRRQKEKWACSKVLAALAASAGSGSAGSNGLAALAAAAGGSSGSSKLYDGSTALKLLQCDHLCAAAAKDKQQQQPAAAVAAVAAEGSHASQRQQKQQQQQQLQAATATAAAAAAGTGTGPTAATAGAVGAKAMRKLSRAEREALAAAKEEERRRQEQQQRMRQAGLIVLALLVVGYVLAVGMEWVLGLLAAMDKTLRAKYAPPEYAQQPDEL